MKKIHIWTSFVLLFTISSCGIQKRQHTKGFHFTKISFNKGGKDNIPASTDSKPVRSIAKKTTQKPVESDISLALSPLTIAENQKLKVNIPPYSGDSLSSGKDTCDQIFSRYSDVIYGKVFELNQTSISYVTCGTSGKIKVKSIRRDDVVLIKYSNGKEERFSEEELDSENLTTLSSHIDDGLTPEIVEEELINDESMGKNALALSFLGLIPTFIPFGILGILFGGILMYRRRRNGNKRVEKCEDLV